MEQMVKHLAHYDCPCFLCRRNKQYNAYAKLCSTKSKLLLACVSVYHIELNGVFPVWALALVIAVVAAVVVAFTSKPYKPPVYHAVCTCCSIDLQSI